MSLTVLSELSWATLPVVVGSLLGAAWLTLRYRNRPPWDRIHRFVQLARTAQAVGGATYLLGALRAGVFPGAILWMAGLAITTGYWIYTGQRLDPEQRRNQSDRWMGRRLPAVPEELEARVMSPEIGEPRVPGHDLLHDVADVSRGHHAAGRVA